MIKNDTIFHIREDQFCIEKNNKIFHTQVEFWNEKSKKYIDPNNFKDMEEIGLLIFVRFLLLASS